MFDLNVIRWFILIPLMRSKILGELIKNKPDGRMGRIMVLFVIQINIIGASDVDPYSSPVPRVGFSTGVFFKYPSGTFTRHHA